MAYTKKIWKDYPDTTTPILAEDLNNIENGIENIENNVNNIENGIEAVDTALNSGWIPLTGTFIYSSADSPTFVMTTSVNLTGIVGLGMRIKLTQTETKYFIVTAITSNSITMYGGTDYTLTNASISNVYYSMLKAPFGFPINPEKWSVISTYDAFFQVFNPTANTWYSTPLSLTVPIGSWNIIGQGLAQAISTSTTAIRVKTAISTSDNSVNDKKNITFAGYNIPTAGAQIFFASSPIEFDTVLTSQTTFYFLISTILAGVTELNLVATNAANTAYIKATCAYL